VDFPSLKAQRMLALLMRDPLNYKITRQKGSHRRLEAENYPPLTFSFHDGATVPPGLVRDYLLKRIGLTEEEALDLL
jgi:predicted RNA binding protein YcfA (HicA-like mRNA interferase family)